jgi:branched-subunit amino acid ABC-type transport system permease component
MLAALIGFGFAGLVGGCAELPDPGRELLCRQALPALNGENARIGVVQASREAGGRIVRIDYRAGPDGGGERLRRARCLFSSETGGGIDSLVGLESDGRPLTGASLYFLKRFWLSSPDAQSSTPTAAAAPLFAGGLGAGFAIAAQQMVSALPAIAITGLFAIAYALIYGLVGRIVLAFGEFAAIAAALTAAGAVAALGTGASGASFAIIAGSSLGAMAATGLLAHVAGRLIERPLSQGSRQAALVATLGLALVLSEGLRLAQGTTNRWLPPHANPVIVLAEGSGFAITTTPVGLIVTGLALLVAAMILGGLQATPIGRFWRAVADDPIAAEMQGVSARRMLAWSFTVAASLAAFAGILMTIQYGGIGFAGGAALGLKALVGAVLGGIGSIAGAFAGGLFIGLFEAAWSATLPIASRDVAVYCMLAAAIIFRPSGLFGRPGDSDNRLRDRR